MGKFWFDCITKINAPKMCSDMRQACSANFFKSINLDFDFPLSSSPEMHPKAARAAGLFICFLILFLIIDDSRSGLEPLPPSSPAEVSPPPQSSSTQSSSTQSSSTQSSSTPHALSPRSPQPLVGSQYWQLFKPGTFSRLSAPCNEVLFLYPLAHVQCLCDLSRFHHSHKFSH